jgi:hypothetical protein
MKGLALALLIFSPLICTAEQLVVEYSSFYNHTKKLQGKDTNILQFAFGFQHVRTKSLCRIQSAFISTQKQDVILNVQLNQRFVLPSEKALKMAKAQVVIELAEAANLCDMSVQLETKPEYLKTVYTKSELNLIFKQYQAFFDDMGGLFSFMMPKVEGLSLHFADKTQLLSLPENLQLENHVLALNTNWIAKNKGLQLDSAPLRITAIVAK